MGALSIWHVLILAVVAMLLFGGRGKVSDLMADVARGIRSFRKGLTEPHDADKQVVTESPRTKIPAA